MSVLTKVQARDLYDGLASRYDRLLFGFRVLGVERHRRSLVAELGLRSGNTVVDLCCGTGANLGYLQDAVGADGRIIGVDLSNGMLDRARSKVDEAGWDNVELVRADVEQWEPPKDVDAVLSTFGLEMVPAYAAIIERLSDVLRPGTPLGLLGLKQPDGWPEWLIELMVAMDTSFGVTRDYEDFRPFEAARIHMEMRNYDEMMIGAAYRCVAIVRNSDE